MSLKRTYYIMQRELLGYFASPLAYVIIGVFLVFSGIVFQAMIAPPAPGQSADTVQVMGNYFNFIAIVLIFIAPVLTTRLIAEENRTGTMELLLTSPIRDTEVVLGKFFATCVLILATFGLTLFYVLAMILFNGQIDWGSLSVGYVGIILMSAVFFSIGLFASSVTSSQVIATVIAIIVALFFFIPSLVVQQGATGPLSDLVNYVTLQGRISDFSRGLIDLRYILYFLSLIIFFNFLAIQALGSRRWRSL